MVPATSGFSDGTASAPRTRGDGPGRRSPCRSLSRCSPHPRGWSPLHLRHGLRAGLLPAPAGMVPAPPTPVTGWELLPAPAGMVPTTGGWPAFRRSAPRTRGDGPMLLATRRMWFSCSPHPRGWSPSVPPPAGRLGLLPAPAGMVPGELTARPPHPPAPRTRGDGPRPNRLIPQPPVCSPHPRGWSQGHGAAAPGPDLLPAPAGMVPRRRRPSRTLPSAPRTRGDGPPAEAAHPRPVVCSPHPRGWSRADDHGQEAAHLLPAPAGMVPAPGADRGGLRAAPRTRGDGPSAMATVPTGENCSPAGMVPGPGPRGR